MMILVMSKFLRFTWAYDFFSEPPISVDGWAGTLRAGELLYMPGDCLEDELFFGAWKLGLEKFVVSIIEMIKMLQ